MLIKHLWAVAALVTGFAVLALTPASAATAGAPAATLDKLVGASATGNGPTLVAQRGHASRGSVGRARSGSSFRSGARVRGPRLRSPRVVRKRGTVRTRRATRRRVVSPRRITRKRALARHGKYIRRRSHWRSWCARHPGKCRRHRYWHNGRYYWYWVPLVAGVLLLDGADDDRCEYWAARCAANWGYGNANYHGCMRYHHCE